MAETDTPPDATAGNPFALIAYVLFKVRHSLEDIEEPGRAPRWVRIARARTAASGQGVGGTMALAVKASINGFAEALAYLAKVTLDVERLLQQTDAAQALFEVTADFIDAATSEDFVDGVKALVGELPGNNPLGGVKEITQRMNQFVGVIPDADDVRVLGHELYRLLCIEYAPLPRTANSCQVDETKIPTLLPIDRERSGKIRLLQWAFGEDLTAYGEGTNGAGFEASITRLGARPLWATDVARLPPRSVVTWHEPGSPAAEEPLFELFFDKEHEADENKRTQDLLELWALLDKFGYTTPPPASEGDRRKFTAELVKRLRRFQRRNDLPPTGELDAATVNRLLGLDHARKNTVRPLPNDPGMVEEPYDAQVVCPAGYFTLVNASADMPEEEGRSIDSGKGRYPYYVAGVEAPMSGSAQVPPGGGWIRDVSGDTVQGFVALRSRNRTTDESRNDGGILSEGEAANGSFFFAARHCEPWVAGRKDQPQEGALFRAHEGPPPSRGAISRMYQWVPIDWLAIPNGWDLFLTASCQRRSLFEERTGTTGLPDSGRIGIECYGSPFYTGRGTVRNPSMVLPEGAKFAEWYPSPAAAAQARSASLVARKRVWSRQEVTLKVPARTTAVLVILEGKLQAGWDIDAYFDDVQLSWRFSKRTP